MGILDSVEPLTVTVALEQLKCIDKGVDGPLNPKREPYLWALFFKLDGASITLDAGLQLTGTVTTHAGTGSHESLGKKVKVKDGDVVAIPPAIGRWQTSLLPIQLLGGTGGGDGGGGIIPGLGDKDGDGIPDLLDDVVDDVGDILDGLGVPLAANRPRPSRGQPHPKRHHAATVKERPRLGVPLLLPAAIGVIFALLEFDWTTEKAAEAGHNAFNQTLTNELNRVIVELNEGGLNLNNPILSEEQKQAIAKKVQDAVIAAVVKRGGILQDVLNFVNGDDFIGADGVVFSTLDLLVGTKQIDRTFVTTNKTGTWQITGSVKGIIST